MTSTDPVRIVIVGGGTAGWMTAAALGHFLDRGFSVQLVESDAIGTIGVGEATIPQSRNFNQAIGIDEDEFARATQASFKLGIEFVGWHRPGSRYIHAFGDVGRDIGLCGFQHYWSRAHRLGLAQPLGDYALNDIAARQGRMHRGAPLTAQTIPAMPFAFHFDAGLYAAFLRQFAEPRGVRRTEGTIRDMVRDGETGDVRAVVLTSGERIAGDLFIDCSGMRALLIGETLGTAYEDWTHWLPCDRALAVQSERSAGALTPYTRSTAYDGGWQWRIPLQHRTGNGRVYCSAVVSDDAAAEGLLANLDGLPITDPRPIRFTTGRRAEGWSHNVVAIGLASGFLEPLESTSIHLIQSAISRLLKLLPGRRVRPSERREYNRQFAFEMERIRDFIILHYTANERDEPFWRACREMALPDSLSRRIELFREAGHIVRDADELFSEVGWMQVLIGQGIIPEAGHALADTVSDTELAEYLQVINALYRREVDRYATHEAFIARHCAAPAPEPVPA